MIDKGKTPLLALRELLGQTQLEVAEAVGISRAFLSKIERGQESPSPELAARLVKHFGDGRITEMQILYPERFTT